jgi:hypothetical protein
MYDGYLVYGPSLYSPTGGTTTMERYAKLIVYDDIRANPPLPTSITNKISEETVINTINESPITNYYAPLEIYEADNYYSYIQNNISNVQNINIHISQSIFTNEEIPPVGYNQSTDPDPTPTPAPGTDPNPTPTLTPGTTPSPTPFFTPSPTPAPGSGDDGGGFWDTITDIIGGGISAVLSGIVKLLVALIGAVVDLIVGVIGKVLEGLGAVVELIFSFFEEIPLLFAGFTAFLGAVFVFVPPEFGMLITFGILLLIVAAVLKRFLG